MTTELRAVTTREELSAIFSKHIKPDDTIFVHAKLSSFGLITCGIDGMLELLAHAVPQGTLVMPAHTGNITLPSDWQNPPLASHIHKQAMEHIEPFRETSPTFKMGKLAELFRLQSSTQRSNHPTASLCASGKKATFYTAKSTTIDFPFQLTSPYGKLFYDDALIVMLGTTYTTCTLLHVAETLSNVYSSTSYSIPIQSNIGIEFINYKDYTINTDFFIDIGHAYERLHPDRVQIVSLHNTQLRFIRSKHFITFAVSYIRATKHG